MNAERSLHLMNAALTAAYDALARPVATDLALSGTPAGVVEDRDGEDEIERARR